MALCDQVRDTAYEIHQYHGNGCFEKVYGNALPHRLRKASSCLRFLRSFAVNL
jgi:hypothetical protein